METTIIDVSDEFLQKVADTKKEVEDYLLTGDESKKPANVKFVKSGALSARRNAERVRIHDK